MVLLPGVSPWVRPCPLWGGATSARMAFFLPPPHCIHLPPTGYLLHESKLFSPARAQTPTPGESGTWP